MFWYQTLLVKKLTSTLEQISLHISKHLESLRVMPIVRDVETCHRVHFPTSCGRLSFLPSKKCHNFPAFLNYLNKMLILSQDFSSGYLFDADQRSGVLLAISCTGITLNLIEMLCYGVFFHYVTYHNNNIASAILQQSVIKQRNNTNAISMLGLFASWLLEIWYIFFVGLLAFEFDISFLREVAAALKDFDFILIPIFQTLTSVPIKKSMFSKSEYN